MAKVNTNSVRIAVTIIKIAFDINYSSYIFDYSATDAVNVKVMVAPVRAAFIVS